MELTPAEELAYWQAAAETADNERRILQLENTALRREVNDYANRCNYLRGQVDNLQDRIIAAAVAR